MPITKSKGPSPHPVGSVGPRRRLGGATAAALLFAVSLSACSSSADSATGTGNTAAGNSGANVDAAKTAIASYSNGKTVPFVADKPLSKPVAPGTKFAFLQCAAQACAVAGVAVKSAVEALGGTVTPVNSGSSAQTAQAAASTVLAMKPAAVIATGLDPQLYGGGLQKIADAGIKIVTISVAVDTKPYGINANYLGAPTFIKAGALMADWVIANKGAGSKVAFYAVPEISFMPSMTKGFQEELTKNCSSCAFRTVNVPIASLGTTAPQTIVTDLQSQADTTVAVFGTGTLASGVPAALSSAGLNIPTLLYSPQAANLQDIKDGKLNAALGVDYNSSVWTGVDVAARLVNGEEPLPAETNGDVAFGFLEKQDITFDPTKGWNPYPDYADRFKKLWLKS